MPARDVDPDNQRSAQGPGGTTTYAWSQENRLEEITFPDGSRSTMAYRSDGLRTRFQDAAADRAMVWDSGGTSGYGDLLEERTAAGPLRRYLPSLLHRAAGGAGAWGGRPAALTPTVSAGGGQPGGGGGAVANAPG